MPIMTIFIIWNVTLSRLCWQSPCTLSMRTPYISCSSLIEVFELKQITFGLFTVFSWYGTKPQHVIRTILQSHINMSSHLQTVKTERYLLHIHFDQSSHTARAQSWWIYEQTFCSEVRVYAHIDPQIVFSTST